MPFEEIIGNNKAKETLNRAIVNDNIIHGYMFSGIEGIGKLLFAKEFAKMILCTSKNNKPCNNCKSCISFDGMNNPDIKIINPDGNSIKIEQIRIINAKIIEKPIVSERKVYIINDSEKMTKDAQNCLLKTLEEPPDFVTIILICSNEMQILNTIKSRCVKIPFNELKDEDMKQYININLKEKENMPKYVNGSIGTLLKIKDKIEIYEQIEKHILNFNNIKKAQVFNEIEILYKEQENIYDILDYLNIYFFNKSKENISYLKCIETVEIAKKRLKANGNYNMTLDMMFLQIWEEINEEHSRC